MSDRVGKRQSESMMSDRASRQLDNDCYGLENH